MTTSDNLNNKLDSGDSRAMGIFAAVTTPPALPAPPAHPAHYGTFIGAGTCMIDDWYTQWDVQGIAQPNMDDCVAFAMSFPEYRGVAYAFREPADSAYYERCYAYYEKTPSQNGGCPTYVSSSTPNFDCYSLEGLFNPPTPPPSPASPPPPPPPCPTPPPPRYSSWLAGSTTEASVGWHVAR